MTTFTALTTLTGKDQAEALGLALEALDPSPTGVGVFEIEDGSGLWEVGGYFVERPDLAGLAILSAMNGAADFVISEVEDRDWVAQVRRELTPVEAGRFVVYGGHDAHRVPMHKTGLRIEAAMAFGTGHHGTTQGCLLALHKLAKQGLIARNVADIGCGTGVLAMAAATLWPAQVTAADIDAVAVATTRANLASNGFATRIRAITAPGFEDHELRARGPYDLVLANILAGPLRRLAPEMSAQIEPGGAAILSGILNRQAQAVISTYKGHGMNLVEQRRIGEWTTLVLRKSRQSN